MTPLNIREQIKAVFAKMWREANTTRMTGTQIEEFGLNSLSELFTSQLLALKEQAVTFEDLPEPVQYVSVDRINDMIKQLEEKQ